MDLAEDIGVPGFSIGIYAAGEIDIWSHGVDSRESGRLVEPTTLFRVGSITKLFVTACVLSEFMKRGVSIDTTVEHVLPGFRVSGPNQTATIRHLLSHSGGWHDHLDVEPNLSLSEFVDDLRRAEASFSPGTTWSYNNSGFAVLGRVLEMMVGKSFPIAVSSSLLDPLGLNRTTFDFGTMVTRPIAVGHNREEDSVQPAHGWIDRPWRRPSGGIATTAPELLTLLAHFVTEQPDSKPPTSRLAYIGSEMCLPQTPDARVGLAWLLDRYDHVGVASLGGGVVGCGSLAAVVPAEQAAFVILTNLAGHSFDRKVSETILDELGVDKHSADPLPESEIPGIIGQYRSDDDVLLVDQVGSDVFLDVVRRSAKRATTGRPNVEGAMPITVSEDGSFVVVGGDRAGVRGNFEFSESGTPLALRFPSLRFERVEAE